MAQSYHLFFREDEASERLVAEGAKSLRRSSRGSWNAMAGLRSGNAWRSSTLGTELDLACQEAYTWMAPNYDSSVQQLEAGITDHYRKEVFRGRPGTGPQSTCIGVKHLFK